MRRSSARWPLVWWSFIVAVRFHRWVVSFHQTHPHPNNLRGGVSRTHLLYEMSDKIINGAAWDRMLEQMFELDESLGREFGSLESRWRPDLPVQPREQASRAWSMLHGQYSEDIHAAACELVRTGRLANPRSEILYFLAFRLDAAIRHLAMAITIREDRPMSLVPFPSVEMSDYAEWLLTEWGDDHALSVAYPEEAMV